MRPFFVYWFVLLLFPYATATADSHLPSCFHIESDQDGDGFGYENSASCIVDSSTRGITEPNICVDDNADGFGWNGIESCSVDVTPNPECEDTEPEGDGWGWDGNGSCRVVPQVVDVLSELEILKENMTRIDGRDRKNTRFYCPSTDETVYLNPLGSLEYYIGQDLIAVGMWSTGIYDKDNLMYVRIDGVDRYFIYLDIQGADVVFGVSTCAWIKP